MQGVRGIMAQTTKLGIGRYFTNEKTSAFDMLGWRKFDSEIINPLNGELVFRQLGVEFPEGWSQNSVNIVAQKYFSGTPGSEQREYSVKQLVSRVADTITRVGLDSGYFSSSQESRVFCEELKFILATQRAAFNSPVWFNIGLPDRVQQASACFILSVDDEMKSILNWYYEEGMIFKGGSGAGVNLSKIRSSVEGLSSSGGLASGPVSFMRGADSSAGSISSGGKTRRAAKMAILNVDHPDIEDFIWCKAVEERKARVLRDAGFDMGLNGKDAISVQYQNANNSVRVSDDFMRAVESGSEWNLQAVNSDKVMKKVDAKDIWRQIAEAAWESADPGVQFDTTINKWHTAPNAGRINASNPCSEYMHLDNSACNLASINLIKYLEADGNLNVGAFRHTVDVMTVSQEILVGYSAYPTKSISRNAQKYRQLGLGYANLGALLMAQGLPYDSPEGRAQAAAITALMTGQAYSASARIAKIMGPFSGFTKDSVAMINVLKMHRSELSGIDASLVQEELLIAAAESWDDAVDLGEKYGVRNSQATVLAPTGTIGLMMDCDTTGIEPDLGLVKHKKLVGGGSMSLVNKTVPVALRSLGYSPKQTQSIMEYIDNEKTIVGAPGIKADHLQVFACSMGDNTIHYEGHVRMMGAVQPFLSGAISKTVNMPEEASAEDVADLHFLAWELGVKAVAIYRDGSKVGQPLSMAKKDSKDTVPEVSTVAGASDNEQKSAGTGYVIKGSTRRELPRVRSSKTYEFSVSSLKGYFTVGEFEDGSLGEVWLNISKQGSTLAGVMDALAVSISNGLQYGVPLKTFVKALTNRNFAPSGMTDDHEIRTASSIVDYVFRRIAQDYLSFDDRLELGLADINEVDTNQVELLEDSIVPKPEAEDVLQNEAASSAETQLEKDTTNANNDVVSVAPLCSNCGNATQRSGSCYVCTSCGSTSGCS